MKVKINQILMGIDGKTPIIGQKGPLTLRDLSVESLLTPRYDLFDQNKNLVERGDTEAEKTEKYRIFKIIRDRNQVSPLPNDHVNYELSLTVEEIMVIKRAIGKIQPPLIQGQAFEILEG